MQSAQIELADITDELESLSDEVNYDESRINYINERMATGYRLLKKHAVQTTNELIEIKNELQQKLDAVLNIEEAISSVQNKFNRQLQSLRQLQKNYL